MKRNLIFAGVPCAVVGFLLGFLFSNTVVFVLTVVGIALLYRNYRAVHRSDEDTPDFYGIVAIAVLVVVMAFMWIGAVVGFMVNNPWHSVSDVWQWLGNNLLRQ